MYDAKKIITGLAIFIVAVTFPFWYGFTFGESTDRPELVTPPAGTQCVEPKAFMKANHMDLLNDWRDAVVREGRRVYVSSDNKEFPMSLTSTCLGCHGKKDDFCGRCHDYVGVRPYCWDCHIANPGETSEQ